MSEKKLANALGLLSLDFAASFERELAAPAVWDNSLRSSVRRVLSDYVEERRYLLEYSIADHRVHRCITSEFGVEAWKSLRTWVDNVFLDGTRGRQPERVWTLILSRGFSGVHETHRGFRDDLYEVQTRIASARSETQRRLESQRGKPLSTWDAMMLPLMYAKTDNVCDEILLIHTYNRLVREWEPMARLSTEELVSVHQWGKQIAAELGIREADVSFPGAWEY